MRTKLWWVNQVLSNCNQDTAKSIEDLTATEFGSKALAAYDICKEWLLSEYPWPFAVSRIQLQRALERPLTTWSHYYHFPNDYGHAWDIYSVEPNYSYRYTYEVSVYQPFFTRDTASTAVMEKGYIATDLESLTMLYTRKYIDEAEFSPHFESVLEKKASIRFARQIKMPSEDQIAMERSFMKDIKESKRSQSLDNPAQQRLLEGRMLRRARGGGGYR